MARVRRSPAILLAAGMLLLGGCAAGSSPTETPQSPEAWSPSPTPPPDPRVYPPDGFPDQFPDPPEGIELSLAELTENALERITDDGDLEQTGTVVHRSYHFQTGNGSAEQAAEIVDYYRSALPAAGWTISDEFQLGPDTVPERPVPTTQLHINGHGWEDARIHVEQRDEVIYTRVSVSEIMPDREPYYAHPPLITLPDWFAELADSLPDDAIRERITVTARPDGESSASLTFRAQQPAAGPDDLETLDAMTEHLRRVLTDGGWTITADESEHDSQELEHSTRETDRRVLEFEGRGATGAISLSQTTYSLVGQPDRVQAAITAEPAPAP